MGVEWWKQEPSTTTPEPPTPAQEELLAVFGARGVELLSMTPEPVSVHRDGPFFWADIAEPKSWSGWVIVDDRAIGLGEALVLPVLIAQSITEPMELTARVAAACRVGRVVVIQTRRQLDGAMDTNPEQQAALRARFEPPHGEGSRWVFCVSDEIEKGPHQLGSDLFRCSVDSESLHVEMEPLGELRQRRMVIRGPAHVDDGGAPVVAAFSADAASPWIEHALAEHAGVAAFARLTLELMAVGAPLDLIGRVQQAALDEVRHAEQALALARRDGIDVVVGALPALAPRPGSRADIARRVHDELVVHEAAAVDDLRAQAAACDDDDDARAVLMQQADDEQRHVELAREIVRWCAEAPDGPV